VSLLPSSLRTLIEIWGGVNVGFTATLLCGLWRLARRPLPPPTPASALLILRPCEGDEPGLYENLLSSLRRPSLVPARRVLFLVPSLTDSAHAVATAVVQAAAADPELCRIPTAVVVTSPPPLENRKVAQLRVGLACGREELVVCADSDVRLEEGDLTALLGALLSAPPSSTRGSGAAGAAFAAPVEVAPQTFWDRASSAVVGGSPQSFLALAGLSALVGGAPSMAGALCAFRRSALDEIGGLESVRRCLGEDHELARRLVGAGYRVALSRRPARCHDGGRTRAQVIGRVARWLTVIRAQRPELLPSYPLLVAATPALLVAALLVRSPILSGFTGAVLMLRMLLCWSLRRFQGIRIGPLRALSEVLVGESLLLMGFLRAAGSRRIRWRGHPFFVDRGGRLRPAA
jgi:ceramide glucosyltransferase